MLTFQLFGTTVRVQWMFWILCLVIGSVYLSNGAGPDGVLRFLFTAAALFLAVLLHEFGHAWARKKFGAPYSEIMLHGIGGYCTGPGQFTRNQSVFVSFAGPLMNFIQAGIAFGLTMTPLVSDSWLAFFLGQMIWINMALGIFNLFPIYPLDGGQIFLYLAGKRRSRLVFTVGLVLAGIFAVLGLVSGQIFMIIIFGMLAFSNWQRLQGQRPVLP